MSDPRAKIVSAEKIVPHAVGGTYGVCPHVIAAHIRNAKWGDLESVESLRNLLHRAAESMPDADVIEVAQAIRRAGDTLLWFRFDLPPMGAVSE